MNWKETKPLHVGKEGGVENGRNVKVTYGIEPKE